MAAEILIGKRGKQNPINSLRTLSNEASFYFKNQSDALLNRTTKAKKRFEDIIPEVLELSLLDQAYLDTSISFASWYRLSIFYQFSDQMVIDKFSFETNKLLNLEG